MTIPRISSVLFILTLGRDALALQLGQISSESSRGQPLSARVALYGTPATAGDALSVEIMPEFGAPQDTLAKLGVHARIESNDSGELYIAIASSTALDRAQLALRVRLKEGSLALVQRYSLTLPAATTPPPARTISRSLPAPAAPTVAMTPNGSYGPVRPGQSLWRILQEIGLARGPSARLMKTIVAMNPSAFVGGDATRLRVGAMLRLPGTVGIATATASTLTSVAPRTGNGSAVGDPALTARLDRLGRQFALIRARYADQEKPKVTRPDISLATSAPAQNRPATAQVMQAGGKSPKTLSKAAPVAKTQLPPPAASNITNLESTIRDNYVGGRTLLILAGAALGIALVTLALHRAQRVRGLRVDAGVRSADRDRVAEIARKTEKRVRLEDEVRRMITGRKTTAEDSMSSGLRPADLLGGGLTSMEDIESHIAHGRYDDAESMLEQIIAAGPDNRRAKLRLAEIYYLNERHDEFVALSEEIHRRHRSDISDDDWARLMRMGKVIAPGRPPFSGPVAVDVERLVG